MSLRCVALNCWEQGSGGIQAAVESAVSSRSRLASVSRMKRFKFSSHTSFGASCSFASIFSSVALSALTISRLRVNGVTTCPVPDAEN